MALPLPILSDRKIIKALRKAGFQYAPKRGKGSHTALYRTDEHGRKMLVIVPKRKQTPRGTLLAILEQAHLSKDEFMELL